MLIFISSTVGSTAVMAATGGLGRMSNEVISIRGARVHNLKNINAEIPLNQLTVITGVSGSGKSSLAFDTIYAEGQRRYVESLSAYARQFLERMDRPDVDEVLGICPPIAIRQKNSTRNPRSTVATQTEIYDYLRLLFARVGLTFCYNCGRLVRRDTPESIADQTLALPEGTRFYVMFPAAAGMADGDSDFGGASVAKKKKRAPGSATKVKAHLMSLMQRGFTRLYRNGATIDLSTPDDFAGDDFDETFVLVDRLKVSQDSRARLIDSVEICYQEGHGQVVIECAGTGPAGIESAGEPARRTRYSEGFECKHCSIVYPAPEPRLFSFNNPFGACPSCQGFGNTIGLDVDLIIPNKDLSLSAGAIEPWARPQYDSLQREMIRFCKSAKIPIDVPFRSLTRDQQNAVIRGRDGYQGVLGFFDWLEQKKYKLHIRVFLSKYRGYTTCNECGGSRLRREATHVRVGGKSLPE